jgi:hypothetical protein
MDSEDVKAIAIVCGTICFIAACFTTYYSLLIFA